MNYTNEQIIKALECCKSEEGCDKCPLEELGVLKCTVITAEYALKQINRLKAENEKLTIELKAMRGAANSYKAEVERLKEEDKNQKLVLEEIEDFINPLPFETDFAKAIRIAKSEARKEFAERLKEKSSSCVTSTNGREIYETKSYTIMATTIDNLLEEMERENGK